MFLKKRNKRGFTVVECVISMAVILIVSGSALVIFQMASRATQRRWDNYQIKLEATNVLTAFQAADDAASFGNLLETSAIGQIRQEDEKTAMVRTQQATTKYDFSERLVSTVFNEVRVYDRRNTFAPHVDFVYIDDTQSPGTEDVVLTFTYEGGDAADVQYELDVKGSAVGSDTASNSNALALLKTNGTNTYTAGSTERAIMDNNVEMRCTFPEFKDLPECGVWTKVANTVYTYGSETKTATTNSFEYLLLSKGYYLVYSSKTGSEDVITVWFTVWNAADNTQVQQGSQPLYYGITGNWGTVQSNLQANTLTGTALTVSAVQQKVGNGAATELKTANNKSFDAGWNWNYYPEIIARFIKDNKDGSGSCDPDGGYTPPETCRVYYVSEGLEAYSIASFAAVREDRIEIYAQADWGSDTAEKTLVYVYHFANVTQAAKDNALDYMKSKLSWADNGKLLKDEDGKDIPNAPLLQNYEKDCVATKVVAETISTGKYQITFYQTSVVDYVQKTKVLFKFEYTEEAVYNANAASMLDAANGYGRYYQEDFTLKDKYQKAPILYSVDGGWLVNMENDQGKEITIFRADTEIMYVSNSQSLPPNTRGRVTTDTSVVTSTSYFCLQRGEYACYIKVVYAEVDGSTQTTGVEPRLYVWLMDSDELAAQNAKTAEGFSEATDPTQDCYLTYRKG